MFYINLLLFVVIVLLYNTFENINWILKATL